MEPITNSQIKAVHVLLSKRGLLDEKEYIIKMLTSNRTGHVTGMTKYEAADLIRYMSKNDPRKGAEDTMRKKIISMAHEMGWHLEGSVKINMDRVNQWCETYGYLHKRLNQYSYAELPGLISQFETVYIKFLKGL